VVRAFDLQHRVAGRLERLTPTDGKMRGHLT
jgi:hypothetical protein